MEYFNIYFLYFAATKREEEVTPVITVDPTCDNSNDSGLGFDQVDYQPHTNSFNNHLQVSIAFHVKKRNTLIRFEVV